MNDPIISPWFIYLADTCTNIKLVACFFAVCTSIGTIVTFIEDHKTFKLCALAAFISCMALVLVPSTRTVYKMLLANNISKQTLQQGVDVYEKLKQDLINGILIIKDGKKCDNGN